MNKNLTAELQSKNSIISNLSNQKDKLDRSVEMLNRKMLDSDKLVAQNEDLSQKLRSFQWEAEKSNADMEKITESLNIKKSSILHLQETNNGLRENISKLIGEVETLRSEMTSLKQLLINRIQSSSNPIDDKTEETGPAVWILHDSLFKSVSEGLLKNEELTAKKLWCPRIHDAPKIIGEQQKLQQSSPKVCVLHVGTNDLAHLSEQEIVNEVFKVHQILKSMESKLIFSTIAPRFDVPKLNVKAQLVNALVISRLEEVSDVIISRNDNLYTNGVINREFYDEDGVHVNDTGASKIANNTRYAVGRALNIEVGAQKKSSSFANRGHFRGGRNGRGGRARGR